MSELVMNADLTPATMPDDAPVSEAEALRRRLVRLTFDVHDGPMQSLTAISYGLRELERQIGDPESDLSLDREAIAAQLAAMNAELAAAEAGLRSLISMLENGKPEIDTVGEITTSELALFSRSCSAATEAILDPPHFQPDTHSQAIAIRSVLREALNNINKHAQADSVLVRIQASLSGVLLEITDDGHGFDPADVPSGRMGLSHMSERVGLLGGSFDILSKPGGPTVVTALLRRWKRPEQPSPAA